LLAITAAAAAANPAVAGVTTPVVVSTVRASRKSIPTLSVQTSSEASGS
jgi:hypothetical protein